MTGPVNLWTQTQQLLAARPKHSTGASPLGACSISPPCRCSSRGRGPRLTRQRLLRLPGTHLVSRALRTVKHLSGQLTSLQSPLLAQRPAIRMQQKAALVLAIACHCLPHSWKVPQDGCGRAVASSVAVALISGIAYTRAGRFFCSTFVRHAS